MQSLWSRAGRAHACGRRVCMNAVHGLSRRATTATVRPRKPTFAEIFTACYSSIFASAAMVDAIRKEDRQQELDHQLDDTRRDLAEIQRLQDVETRRIANGLKMDNTRLTPDQMGELWLSIRELTEEKPFLKEVKTPFRVRRTGPIHTYEVARPYPLRFKQLKQLRSLDFERLERAIMAEERDPRIKRRHPLNERQLFSDFRTVVHVIDEMLNRAWKYDPKAGLELSFRQARQLARDARQKYNFDFIDPERAGTDKATLNQRLREILDCSETMPFGDLVGRICYNMLVATHPPDMHTYNLLIVGFTKLGKHQLAESLVNSFFYRRRLRPTPSTYVAILQHYWVSGNIGQFFRVLECLIGTDEKTGAKLGRRHIEDVVCKRTSREWKGGHGFNIAGDYVYRQVPLDQPLLETIIGGLLHFDLFDQAARFFVDCMQSDVWLSAKVTKQLLAECIFAMDWRSAVRLVKTFANYGESLLPILLNRIDDASTFVLQLRALVQLAGLDSSVQTVSSRMLSNLGISSENFGRFMGVLSRLETTSQLSSEGFNGEQRGKLVAQSNSTPSESSEGENCSLAFSYAQTDFLRKEYRSIRRATQAIEQKLMYDAENLSVATRKQTINLVHQYYRQLHKQSINDWEQNREQEKEAPKKFIPTWSWLLEGEFDDLLMQARTIEVQLVSHRRLTPQFKEAMKPFINLSRKRNPEVPKAQPPTKEVLPREEAPKQLRAGVHVSDWADKASTGLKEFVPWNMSIERRTDLSPRGP